VAVITVTRLLLLLQLLQLVVAVLSWRQVRAEAAVGVMTQLQRREVE